MANFARDKADNLTEMQYSGEKGEILGGNCKPWEENMIDEKKLIKDIEQQPKIGKQTPGGEDET